MNTVKLFLLQVPGVSFYIASLEAADLWMKIILSTLGIISFTLAIIIKWKELKKLIKK